MKHRKYWTEEEIQFLTFSYPNEDFSVKEIAKALNRDISKVRVKACALNLKRPKEIFPEGYKRCSKCKTILPLEFFSIRKNRKNGQGRVSWCRECIKNKKKDMGYNETEPENIRLKKCRICEVEKPISEFYEAKQNKDGLRSECKVCKGKALKLHYIKGGY